METQPVLLVCGLYLAGVIFAFPWSKEPYLKKPWLWQEDAKLAFIWPLPLVLGLSGLAWAWLWTCWRRWQGDPVAQHPWLGNDLLE